MKEAPDRLDDWMQLAVSYKNINDKTSACLALIEMCANNVGNSCADTTFDTLIRNIGNP